MIAVKFLLLLLIGAGVWFGLIRRPTARGQFNLPVGFVEALEGQIEALQLAREEETADRIVESLHRDFAALLEKRGVSATEFKLLLPPPGEVGAVRVEHSSGQVWFLNEFDAYVDQTTGSA